LWFCGGRKNLISDVDATGHRRENTKQNLPAALFRVCHVRGDDLFDGHSERLPLSHVVYGKSNFSFRWWVCVQWMRQWIERIYLTQSRPSKIFRTYGAGKGAKIKID
jgi:hypothetical protein